MAKLLILKRQGFLSHLLNIMKAKKISDFEKSII